VNANKNLPTLCVRPKSEQGRGQAGGHTIHLRTTYGKSLRITVWQ